MPKAKGPTPEELIEKLQAGFLFCNIGSNIFHHQASFDDYKAANDAAAADDKKQRVEAFEKLQAEVDALKESREVAKSSL